MAEFLIKSNPRVVSPAAYRALLVGYLEAFELAQIEVRDSQHHQEGETTVWSWAEELTYLNFNPTLFSYSIFPLCHIGAAPVSEVPQRHILFRRVGREPDSA